MSSMSWSAPSHSRRLLHSRRRSLSTKTSLGRAKELLMLPASPEVD